MARVNTGQVAVSGTAQAVTSDPAVQEYAFFVIRALAANVDGVYVGPSSVTTTNGHELQPGEELRLVYTNRSGELVLDIRPEDLYVVGTSPDRISWIATSR